MLSQDKNTSSNILQIVGNLPDFLRKPIILKKLYEFYSFDEGSKYDTISMILQGSSSLQPNKLFPLIKTWLQILADLESTKVIEIFRIYCTVLFMNPTFFEKLNIEPLVDAYLKLDNKDKEKLSDCLKEAIFLSPNRTVIKTIPESIMQKLKNLRFIYA